MEAVAAEITDGAEGSSLIVCINSLSRILHYHEMMAGCDLHDLIHGTTHTGIVDGNDDLRFVCDGILNETLIQVHRVGTDIHKNQGCSALGEGIRCGDKGVGGKNDLIPRFHLG